MKRLVRSGDPNIIVDPRWPYREVFVSEQAYDALVKAQAILNPCNIKLVLTRGYENQGRIMKSLHAVARRIGATLFCCLYPKRSNECGAIFSANGHDDASGDNVDIGFIEKGARIVLLPRGVFTSQRAIEHLRRQYEPVLTVIVTALTSSGFVVHPNQTEAMQIHCEFRESAA